MVRTITTILSYAYVKDITLLPNILFIETVDDVQVTAYKSRISITYDLKDDAGNFVEQARREHFSDANETMLTYAQYKAWQSSSEAAFIAADKLDLVNFTGE